MKITLNKFGVGVIFTLAVLMMITVSSALVPTDFTNGGGRPLNASYFNTLGNTVNYHESVINSTVAAKVYGTMPTQAQLQADINADIAAHRAREYILPSGTISISGDLTVGQGITLQGVGDNFDGYGTTISLSNTGRIVLSKNSGLESLKIVVPADTTKDAIYSYGSPTDSAAHNQRLVDLTFTGGSSSYWMINLENAYNTYIEDVFGIITGNGLKLGMTSDHPYNPGDSTINYVHFRLRNANTKALSICGQNSGTGSYTNNKINDITFIGFYATSGDIAGWSTNGCTGIEIVNVGRIRFIGCNLEELQTDVTMTGSVNGGSSIDQIEFTNSWAREAFIVNGGCTNIAFSGMMNVMPTGPGLANLRVNGKIHAAYDGVITTSPRYVGSLDGNQAEYQLLVKNVSGQIGSNKIVAWDNITGRARMMIPTDTSGQFCGINSGYTVNDGDNCFVTIEGTANVKIDGSANIGDYVGLTSNGYSKSLGANPTAGKFAVGTVISNTTAGYVTIHIRPQTF